jgi:hypothetical protein
MYHIFNRKNAQASFCFEICISLSCCVVGIRDNLVRIRGSLPPSNRSGSDRTWILLFSAVAFNKFQSISINKFFFLITVLFEGIVHLHQSLKIKGYKEVTNDKAIEIQVFLTFLLDDGRIRIRIRTYNDGSGSGRPKNFYVKKRTPKKPANTKSCDTLAVQHPPTPAAPSLSPRRNGKRQTQAAATPAVHLSSLE